MGKDREDSDGHVSEPQSPSLPCGMRPLSHQVAGHHKKKNQVTDVFLECDNCTVMKPMQPPPKGPREVEFYQGLFSQSCVDPVLLELRGFLPCFLGMWTSPDGVTYLQLEDITKRFRKPCIIDVKVGPVTYDPMASAEKIASEKAKYPPLEKVGFQILGMRVYHKEGEESVFYDRVYGRELAEEAVLCQGLGKYFNLEHSLRKDVIVSVIDKLEAIRSWFRKQRQLSFYASSLLIVYDADTSLRETSDVQGNPFPIVNNLSDSSRINCSSSPEFTTTSKQNNTADLQEGDFTQLRAECAVKMIDFTHVFPTADQDDNYLFGLESLINHLQKLVNMR